jgi:hypothetical protein
MSPVKGETGSGRSEETDMLAKLFLLGAIYVFVFRLIPDDTRHRVFQSIFNQLGHPEYTAAG